MTLTWRGPWDGNTAYAVNDGVFHQNLSWQALAASTGIRPGTNDAVWGAADPPLNWRGVYAATNNYAINDAVVDAKGQGWSAVQPVPAGSTYNPVIASAYWQPASLPVTYKGAYDPAITYQAGDTIRYLGGSYKLIVANAIGQIPPLSPGSWQTLYAAPANTTLQPGAGSTIPLGASGSSFDLTSGRYLDDQLVVRGSIDASGTLGYAVTQDGYFRAKHAIRIGVANGLSWRFGPDGFSTIGLGTAEGVLPLGSAGNAIDTSTQLYAFGQPVLRAWADGQGRAAAMVTGDGYLRAKLAIDTGVANGLRVAPAPGGFTRISLGTAEGVLPLGSGGDGVDTTVLRYAGGQAVWRAWADPAGRVAAYISSDGTFNAKFPSALQNAGANAATALATANAALAAAGSGAITKLKRLAGVARNDNAWDRPVLADGPTVTITNAATAGLTKAFPVAGSGAVPAAFNTFGGAVTNFGSDWRLQAVSMPSGGNLGNGRQANTQTFEWASDAPSLDIILPGATTLWRLLIDGYYVSKTGQAYASTNAPNYIHIDWAGRRGARDYRIEIEQAAAFTGVTVGPGDCVWAPSPDQMRLAIFGDSYTAGTGASLQANGWAAILGHLLGAPHPTQIALGGTGYVTDSTSWRFGSHLTDLGLQSYEAVIWAGGINDAGQDTAAITAAALACLRSARAFLPSAPQVVLGCWPGSSGPNAAHLAAEAAIAAAVLQAADPSIIFVPVLTDACGPWIGGTGYAGQANGSGNADFYITADGTHPNDAGHDYLARRAAAAIMNSLEH